MNTKIPRDKNNEYTREVSQTRREFAKEQTGIDLEHAGKYSIDPATTQGNAENFIGAAQVLIGLAGLLMVNGENAKGEFYVPLATTEATLIAVDQPNSHARQKGNCRSHGSETSSKRNYACNE